MKARPARDQDSNPEPTTHDRIYGVAATLVVAGLIVALLAGLWVLIYGPCAIWACG